MNRFLRQFAWRAGRAIYCRARGEPINDDIASNGESDVQRAVIRALLPLEKICVLDIGANQGDWTTELIRSVAPSLRSTEHLDLHLFEPVPLTREKLSWNLSTISAGEYSKVHSTAISDHAGSAEMAIVGPTSGRNSLILHASEAVDYIQVETLTLEKFFTLEGIERANLVKIDTEGNDAAVLKGSRNLLADEKIDVIQFEYNHRWIDARSFLRDIFDIIDGTPYSLGRYKCGSIEIFEQWHPELERFFHSNYLLIRNNVLNWFSIRRGHFDISNTYT